MFTILTLAAMGVEDIINDTKDITERMRVNKIEKEMEEVNRKHNELMNSIYCKLNEPIEDYEECDYEYEPISDLENQIIMQEKIVERAETLYSMDLQRFKMIPSAMKDTEHYRKYYKRLMQSEKAFQKEEHKLLVLRHKLGLE